MVKKIIIEIEIPERLHIWQDADIYDEEDAFKKLGKDEVLRFQKEKTEELYNYIKSNIEEYIKEDENFIMGIHENVVSIEDWDSIEDYDIKVNVKEETQGGNGIPPTN